MNKTVTSIEVLRCHECRILLHPQEPMYRRQLKTAVEVGTRTGRVDRYEVVDLCANCDAYFARKEEKDRKARWWGGFWVVTTVVCCIAPFGPFILGGMVIVRWAYCWRKKQGLRGQQTLATKE